MRKIQVLLAALLLVPCFSSTVFSQYPYPQPYPPPSYPPPSPQYPQYPQYQQVGIPSGQMNFFSASQNNSQWCWAASIQMVLNYYGVAISQEQIVARTYGTNQYGSLPDWPGSFPAITANLNNWSIDNRGRPYSVMASLNPGAPVPVILIRELSAGRPIIVGYKSGPNSGHAVVVTGAVFTTSPQGPIIHSVIARDPWPSGRNMANLGRVEYPGARIASLMQAYWYIQVQ